MSDRTVFIYKSTLREVRSTTPIIPPDNISFILQAQPVTERCSSNRSHQDQSTRFNCTTSWPALGMEVMGTDTSTEATMRNEQRPCDDSARCPTPRWVWVILYCADVYILCQPRSPYILTSVSETLLH